MNKKARIPSYIFFIFLIISGVFFIINIDFEFNFEDFFPKNDPDLDFFTDFVKDFETDDNFFLIALDREEGIFDSTYLNNLAKLTTELKQVSHVKEVLSLSQLKYPIKTPFGISSISAIHPNEPLKYKADRTRILEDERFIRTLVNEDLTSSLISLKLKDGIDLNESNTVVNEITDITKSYDFENYHLLGRANFQKEMIEMSSDEIKKSTILAGLLVLFVMIWVFKKRAAIFLTMGAITLSMLAFMSYIGYTGQSLNALAGLYPILMIIVSTSDIIHLLSKYIDELNDGKQPMEAMQTTIRNIGLATLLTSVTTSIGFATLLFSRLGPIQGFGINAAAGVLIAYVVIILFSYIFFPMFTKEDLIHPRIGSRTWDRFLERVYNQTILYPRRIFWATIAIMVISAVGINMITTNYTLVNNLPLGQKITKDYHFFEENYSGFRPLEIAVIAAKDKLIDDYEVMSAIAKVENHLSNYPSIKNIQSYTSVYKSINRMMNGNKVSAYTFPKDSATFAAYQRYAKAAPKQTSAIMLSKDKTKSRISTRVDDIGAETVQSQVEEIQKWINNEISPDIATFRLTGTAMLLDKNTFYVRESLIKGLGFAIMIVSLIMVLLFKNIKLLIISIVPNLIPLIISAAIIGFVGIELEAGLSIIFAIAFGIAVDDTIHFLSKYKLEIDKGKSVEEAVHITFLETGKAIILTSLILFFGFLVLLFSIHPPSRSIGLLIGITLITALLADLYLIPGLIRYFFAKKEK